MICNVAADMTHDKCKAVRNANCGKCPGPGTEILTFDETTYETFRELAEFEGVTVATALTRFLTELANDLRGRVL